MPFAILTFGRTGSNWMQSLLNSHPSIHCDSEILGPWNNTADRLRCLSAYQTKTSGFRAMYIHINDIVLEQRLHDFKIIHLVRDNILEQYVSYHLAKINHKWIGEEYQQQSFQADYQDLASFITKIENQIIYFEKLFPLALKITYENLVANTHKEMNEIQKFIGVSVESLYSRMIRQRKVSLQKSIENYNELYNECKGSQYERFFEPICG